MQNYIICVIDKRHPIARDRYGVILLFSGKLNEGGDMIYGGEVDV